MPPAEHAGPFWGILAQVLDSPKVHVQNADRSDAHSAAGIATTTGYEGAGLAAELDAGISMSVSLAQSSVASIQRDIQSLTRRLGDLAKDEATKSSKIASVSKSITKSTSISSLETKQREIQRLQEEIARIRDKKASVSKDIATKTEKLHRAQQHLFNEQQKEQKRSLESLAHENRERDHIFLGQLQHEIPPLTTGTGTGARTMYDAFISHATEDKEDLVRPLADVLRRMGHFIWYDEFQLKVGDSLRRSIDNGLASSRFGIVVLSPSFFAKQWPQYELDGLVAREIAGGKVILPLWHKVSKNEVMNHSPSLADKVALNTASYTIEELGRALSQVLKGT
jgi:hypothetical protein